MAQTEFLGIEFDALSLPDVEHWVGGRSADSPFAYVVTPNVDHIVRLADSGEDVRMAYARADLCLCDSRVLKRLARLRGVNLSVVPGSDLVAATFARVLRDGDRVCLIGSTAAHAATLKQRFPGIAIVHHTPPMGLRHDSVARNAAIAVAQNAHARLVLLAVGSPQQEMLAYEMAASGGLSGTALCIGAAVEFLVGAKARAPLAFQRAGMEWAWRLMMEPRRLARRYLVEGPKVLPMVMRWRRDRG